MVKMLLFFVFDPKQTHFQKDCPNGHVFLTESLSHLPSHQVPTAARDGFNLVYCTAIVSIKLYLFPRVHLVVFYYSASYIHHFINV